MGISIFFVGIICFDVSIAKPELASKYTEEEHIERITERIEKHYIDNSNYSFSSFEVYPIYNSNDVLKYALVEFQPFGFVYVFIRNEEFHNSEKSKLEIPVSSSMYMLSTMNYKIEQPWSPSYIEDGEIKFKEEEYSNSPFYVNNIENEKRYFINIDPSSEGYLVPAVKRDDKYINLYSNEEFALENGLPTTKQTLSTRISYINRYCFDLRG